MTGQDTDARAVDHAVHFSRAAIEIEWDRCDDRGAVHAHASRPLGFVVEVERGLIRLYRFGHLIRSRTDLRGCRLLPRPVTYR